MAMICRVDWYRVMYPLLEVEPLNISSKKAHGIANFSKNSQVLLVQILKNCGGYKYKKNLEH